MSISVLIVDDSLVIRESMKKALASNPGIIVAGTASDGRDAVTLTRELKPDITILDVEMPVMDGITALPELVRINPGGKIIMFSSGTLRNASISLQALALGATDYLAKPSAKTGESVEQFYSELARKILALGKRLPITSPATSPSAIPKNLPAPIIPLAPGQLLNPAGIHALAIASSTGGPQALMTLFNGLKGHLKQIPVFITQHMPPTFTTIFAEQLAKAGERPCNEGKEGTVAMSGNVYVAPGDFHMLATKNDKNETVISLNKNPPENFCRPAADPMLRSLSAIYGKHLAVVVLTGMGHDGLEGSKEVVGNGGSVIAQDQSSCVVYGMPKAVVDNNLCKAVLPLVDIAQLLIEQIDGGKI